MLCEQDAAAYDFDRDMLPVIENVLRDHAALNELGWQGEKNMKGLIFHELGHLWHESAGCRLFPRMQVYCLAGGSAQPGCSCPHVI